MSQFTLAAIAARQGSVLILDHLERRRTLGTAHSQYIVNEAARMGQVEAMIWLRTHGHRVDKKACLRASRYGRLELLQWFLREGKLTNPGECAHEAASNGFLGVIQWFNATPQIVNFGLFPGVVTGALQSGNVELLQWLHDEGCQWPHGEYTIAATAGKIDSIRWIQANLLPFAPNAGELERVFRVAAEGGYIEILEWALGIRGGLNDLRCGEHAACENQFETLKWLHANGLQLNAPIWAAAADIANMEMLEWLYDKQCPTDAIACLNAAEHDDLAMLIWLREHDSPWDARTVKKARNHGYHRLRKWAIANGCPIDTLAHGE